MNLDYTVEGIESVYKLLKPRVVTSGTPPNSAFSHAHITAMAEIILLVLAKSKYLAYVLDRDLLESAWPKTMRNTALFHGEQLGLIERKEYKGKPAWVRGPAAK